MRVIRLLHKLHSNKKALSPIFATLSLLVIVIVLFIPVFYWSTNLTVQTKSEVEAQGVTATESIVIEEVSLGTNQQYCIVYLRNIGKTAVSINDVLIQTGTSTKTYEKSLGELAITNPANGAAKTSSSPGELIAIRINNLKGLSLISGQLYTIKVFTTNGVGEEFPLVL
jgi:uncharacterized protein (UPF0333 family)